MTYSFRVCCTTVWLLCFAEMVACSSSLAPDPSDTISPAGGSMVESSGGSAGGVGGKNGMGNTGGSGGIDEPSTASERALKRILPTHYRQFILREDLNADSGDKFRIASEKGLILVEGTSPAVALTGAGWYLKYVAGVDVSWPGSSVSKLPETLPLPSKEILVEASVPHRFALNDTDDGYSGPYRDWNEWEHTIDLLALSGYNEVLVTVGQEAVYQATFQDFGYSREELAAWIPAPAQQPWWLMQNLCCVSAPISQELIDGRLALGRKIFDRLKELGMTSVYPGYFGTVPLAFTSKNPEAVIVPQGIWTGVTERPDWLDTTTELFAEVAESFYEHQASLLGATTMYKMDLLHEGGTVGDVPIPDATRGVMTALQKARPGATWVLLGWLNNPRLDVLNAVDKSHLLVVDGLSDRNADPDRESDWNNTPYAFGTIPNFGGSTTLGANATTWAARFEEWRSKPNSLQVGIAYMPEGTGTDPAAFELFSELAWRKGELDLVEWFSDYATRRYGGQDENAQSAWSTLLGTVYSMPPGADSDAQDSLFAARPSLTIKTAARWSPQSMRYDGAALRPALHSLLRVRESLRSSDAYRFDLVNVARQVLTNESRVLLPQIAAAYSAKDLARFRVLVDEWHRDILLLDEIVSTDPRLLIGRWIAQARSWSTDPAEKDLLETNARVILTQWLPTAEGSSQLRDYANREWSGLVKDFYAMRWNTFFAALDAALSAGIEPATIDWFSVENTWVQAHQEYPVEPVGDPHAVAARIAVHLAELVSGRSYELRARHSGLCVDAAGGSTENGTNIQQWSCNGTVAQRFRAEARDGGYYRFVNEKSGKCLDITAGGTEPGANLQLWTCNGTVAQDFRLEDAGSGYHMLVNRKSSLCVELENASSSPGGNLALADCGDAPTTQSLLFY